MHSASALSAPDWHEHTAAHLLPLIPILPVIKEGCDRSREMRTAEQGCNKHTSGSTTRSTSVYCRPNQVHDQPTCAEVGAAVTRPCSQNSFIWTDKYPCNYSSSHTYNGWLIQSDCPWSAVEGSPLFKHSRLWQAEAAASWNYISMGYGAIV